MRRRDSLLACLELFRRNTPDLWVNNILTFLYVCENEGLNIKELAQLARLSEPTASRSIRGQIARSSTSFRVRHPRDRTGMRNGPRRATAKS